MVLPENCHSQFTGMAHPFYSTSSHCGQRHLDFNHTHSQVEAGIPHSFLNQRANCSPYDRLFLVAGSPADFSINEHYVYHGTGGKKGHMRTVANSTHVAVTVNNFFLLLSPNPGAALSKRRIQMKCSVTKRLQHYQKIIRAYLPF